MATFVDEYTKLKTVGNDYFLKGDFAKAEEAYSALLLNFDRDRAILFTNRSAARLGLGRQDEALSDAEQAIELDKKWIKAYYRKASALEALKRPKDIFDTWMVASEECDSESSPWLSKQIHTAKSNWVKVFRQVPVVDDTDFIVRYGLLSDSRERLSTLAHFWNDSTLLERKNHFHSLIALIGGESDQSDENKSITEANMPPMPLHNYEDMPRTAVQLWCDYFLSLDSLLKTELLQKMWQILSNDEQTAVITDLRQFIAMSLRDDINGIVGDRQDVLADNDNKNKNNNNNGDGDNNDSDI